MSEGDCFVAALRVLEDYNADERDDWRLVHGLVRHPEQDTHHWHAWVELTRIVSAPYTRRDGSVDVVPFKLVEAIDRSNGHNEQITAAMYYKLGDIKCVKRYTLQEARVEMLRCGHYGPWHDEEETD
jgi:hypothetical protein